MAGIGLGKMVAAMFHIGPYFGLNYAMEALVSTAYGAGNFKLCGVYLWRGRIVNTIILIPLAIFTLFMDKILLAIGQDPEVVKHAYPYILVMIPTTYITGLGEL